jgi:hypothetical protein
VTCALFNALKPNGYRTRATTCDIQQFCVSPTQRVYVFWVDLRTNNDYLFPYTEFNRFFHIRDLTLYSPVVTICTTRSNIKNSTFCPHCVYVFCVDLRTNSDYFPIRN